MMLFEVLAHTPRWVFLLFALLVWMGCKQLAARTVSLLRATLMPLAMTGLSLYGVASTFGHTPVAMAGWSVAALLLALLVLQRPLPASTRYDAATRTFHTAGSAVPLVLMMGIFFTKYLVGVELAMHPSLAHSAGFALAAGTLYGAFSGSFAARAMRLGRLAMRQNRTASAA